MSSVHLFLDYSAFKIKQSWILSVFWGEELIIWNNLVDFSQAENTVVRGHSDGALPHGAFNGLLTLVITKEDSGLRGLETNWPDETVAGSRWAMTLLDT